MLIQFADVLKPYQNLRRRHTGLVVKVDDPKFEGRIKVKIQGLIESDDLDRLPWCYPDERHSRGGRPDSMVSAVPPLYSLVEVEFPAFGDDAKVGGSQYYPVYAGMTRNDLTNSPIATDNATPEDGALSQPNAGSPSKAESLEVNVWDKMSDAPAWIRIDRAKGSIEFFDSDTAATLYWHRGGHLQIKAASLDVETTEDVRFKVGGIWHQQVEGDTFVDCRSNIFNNATQNIGFNAQQNIDSTALRSYGVTATNNIEVIAGVAISVSSGSSTSFTSGANFSVEAVSNISLVAGLAVSIIAPTINMFCEAMTIVAPAIGVSTLVPLITIGWEEGDVIVPPQITTGVVAAPLGTVAILVAALAAAVTILVQRFTAFEAVVAYLTGQAAAVKAAGLRVKNFVQDWASQLIGTDLG